MISRRNLKYPAIHGGDSLLKKGKFAQNRVKFVFFAKNGVF
jgi:hypothetical protein